MVIETIRPGGSGHPDRSNIMITVTTSTGTKVSLENTGSNIIASIVGTQIKFGAVQTATGFASRFLVSELQNTRAQVILSGNDLAASNGLFAEQARILDKCAAQDAEYERRRQQILDAE
jgi:hypothetical protein